MATATGTYVTATLLKQSLYPAGTTDTTDDTLLGLICDRVNQDIEDAAGRVIAPVGTATWTEDVWEPGVTRLYINRGIRSLVTLELADYTNAAYVTLPSTDYFLRPGDDQRAVGWPYTELFISDIPTGGFSTFPRGFATVRLTATTGWAVIPDSVTELAIVMASRAWAARQSGQQDIIGTDEMGRPVVSRILSSEDRNKLRAYTIPSKLF